MTKEVKIPQISEGSDEATVAEIHVSEGDKVEGGQELIAVESDKATVDVPNEEGAGTVKEIKVSKGDTVNVGDVILILEMDSSSDDAGEDEEEDEDSSDESSEKSAEEDNSGEEEYDKKQAKNEGDEEEKPGSEEEKDDDAEEEEADSEKQSAAKDQKAQPSEQKPKEDELDSDGAPAAPLAKKFARELGIDISELKKGEKERISRDDVMEHAKKLIQQGGKSQQAATGPGGGIEPIELPDFSKWGETERQPLSGIRTVVAKNTTKSWQNIPHVTQHDKADITELQVFREKQEAKGQKASVTAILTKICLAALKKFPQFNASLDMYNRELVVKKYFNIGIAADTDDGLMMPVLKEVDQKSLLEIHEELKELADKARNRKLKPDEMQGGNFTISNLGGIGGTSFTPVIFPPQVAILGVSAASIQPQWIEDEFVPSEIMTLSLSYDHRVIDGADAARFLRYICDVIEEPLHLLG